MWTCDLVRAGVELSDGTIWLDLKSDEMFTLWALLGLLLGKSTGPVFLKELLRWDKKRQVLLPLDIVRIDDDSPNFLLIRLWRPMSQNSNELGKLEYRISRESASDLLNLSQSAVEDDLGEDDLGEDAE